MSPLVVVAGTGTGIGKTAIASALTKAWGNGRRIAGVKPIESGGTEDGAALGRVSTFHVTRFPAPYTLTHPVSPHLAARAEGVTIDPERIAAWLAPIRAEADGVVLETAGGLFSPLAPGVTNADLARRLAPSRVLLVAPDRLGVLHDVAATTIAARATGLVLDGIVLSAPEHADPSTGTNAAELAGVTDVPVLASVPRTTLEELARLLAGLVP